MVFKLQENQQVLHQAINNGLLTLGEPIMETIQWHLKNRGVFLDSNEDIDVRRFYQHLEQIVGHIADMIMDEIYENLRQGNKQESLLNLEEPVINRIEQLLEANMGGRNSK
jgi:hypothetical protein